MIVIALLVGLSMGWLIRRELALRERKETRAMWEQQLLRAESQRDGYRSSSDAKDERVAKLEVEVQRYGAELDQMRKRIADRDLELREVEDQVKHHDSGRRAATRRAHELTEKNEALARESERDRTRCQALESENLLFREMLSTAEIALMEKQRAIEELETRPRPAGTPPEPRSLPKRPRRELPSLDPLLELMELEERLTPRGTRVTKLPPPPEPGPEPTPLPSFGAGDLDAPEVIEANPIPSDTRRVDLPEAPADDLTRVKGIGPAFADRLEGIGVRRIRQIAEWDDEEVEEAAEALGISPRRIRRGGWVESARSLL